MEEGTYEIVVLHESHDVQRLEMQEAWGELREQLVRRWRVDNEDREPSKGRRCPRKYLERAVPALREGRERDALHRTRRDHLRRYQVSPTDSTRGVGWHYFAESVRVHGHQAEYSRCHSAEGWRVNGLKVHAGMPRGERSRISGCDSRNAAKSGSSLSGGGRPRQLLCSAGRQKVKVKQKTPCHARKADDRVGTCSWNGASRGNINANARCLFS